MMKPKVLHYHFKTTRLRVGQESMIVDVANVDIKHLEIINLTRDDAKRILLTWCSRKKTQKAVKSFFAKLKDSDIPTFGCIGIFMQRKNSVYYSEAGEIKATVRDTIIPLLRQTCYACGAHGPFTCPNKICNFRYCSVQCEVLKPFCHTIACSR